MKTFFLLVIVFLTSMPTASMAQVTIQTTPNSSLNFSSEQSLKCIITSTLTQKINVFLEATVNSEKGMPIVKIVTKPFTINQGVNTFSDNLPAFTKKYINQDFGTYESTNGTLPSGSYAYCVQLKCANNICLDAFGVELPGPDIQTCNSITTISPTPLLLASPLDEAKLTEKRPNFSWIPPMPIGSDPNLTYSFTLVELNEKQSAESGIRRNRALYHQKGITNLLLVFPAELDDLRVGKKYAWKVDALLGKTWVQTSQVWEFEIVEEQEQVIPMPYVRIKLQDPQTYNAVNSLKFIFTQEGSEPNLNYSVYKSDGTPAVIDLPSMNISPGENQLDLDLTSLGLEHNNVYVLRVTDEDNRVYHLNFKYFFKKSLK